MCLLCWPAATVPSTHLGENETVTREVLLKRLEIVHADILHFGDQPFYIQGSKYTLRRQN